LYTRTQPCAAWPFTAHSSTSYPHQQASTPMLQRVVKGIHTRGVRFGIVFLYVPLHYLPTKAHAGKQLCQPCSSLLSLIFTHSHTHTLSHTLVHIHPCTHTHSHTCTALQWHTFGLQSSPRSAHHFTHTLNFMHPYKCTHTPVLPCGGTLLAGRVAPEAPCHKDGLSCCCCCLLPGPAAAAELARLSACM
jgi:hypothetical protein